MDAQRKKAFSAWSDGHPTHIPNSNSNRPVSLATSPANYLLTAAYYLLTAAYLIIDCRLPLAHLAVTNATSRKAMVATQWCKSRPPDANCKWKRGGKRGRGGAEGCKGEGTVMKVRGWAVWREDAQSLRV